ncbi:putative Phenylalanyl-tRNA synthetase beta chain [Streptomyces misionensis JCM 4497]
MGASCGFGKGPGTGMCNLRSLAHHNLPTVTLLPGKAFVPVPGGFDDDGRRPRQGTVPGTVARAGRAAVPGEAPVAAGVVPAHPSGPAGRAGRPGPAVVLPPPLRLPAAGRRPPAPLPPRPGLPPDHASAERAGLPAAAAGPGPHLDHAGPARRAAGHRRVRTRRPRRRPVPAPPGHGGHGGDGGPPGREPGLGVPQHLPGPPPHGPRPRIRRTPVPRPAAGPGRVAAPGRPGPRLRRPVRRPQPHPPAPAHRPPVRLPARDRPRHVDGGAVPRRVRRHEHGPGALPLPGAAAGDGALRRAGRPVRTAGRAGAVAPVGAGGRGGVGPASAAVPLSVRGPVSSRDTDAYRGASALADRWKTSSGRGRVVLRRGRAAARRLRDAGGRAAALAGDGHPDPVDHDAALRGHRSPGRCGRPHAAPGHTGAQRRGRVCARAEGGAHRPDDGSRAGAAHLRLAVRGPGVRVHRGTREHGEGQAARAAGRPGRDRRQLDALHRARRPAARAAAVRGAGLHTAGHRLHRRLLRPGGAGGRRAPAHLPGGAEVRRKMAGTRPLLAHRTDLRRPARPRLHLPAGRPLVLPGAEDRLAADHPHRGRRLPGRAARGARLPGRPVRVAGPPVPRAAPVVLPGARGALTRLSRCPARSSGCRP